MPQSYVAQGGKCRLKTKSSASADHQLPCVIALFDWYRIGFCLACAHESQSSYNNIEACFLWTLSQIISVHYVVDTFPDTNVLKMELTNRGNSDGRFHYIMSFPVPLRNRGIVRSLKPPSTLCNYLLSLYSCPGGGKKISKVLGEFGSVQENDCTGWLEPLFITCLCLPPLYFAMLIPPWR